MISMGSGIISYNMRSMRFCVYFDLTISAGVNVRLLKQQLKFFYCTQTFPMDSDLQLFIFMALFSPDDSQARKYY